MRNIISLRDIKKLTVSKSFTDATKIKSTNFHFNGEFVAYSQISNKEGFHDFKEIKVVRLEDRIESVSQAKVQKYGAGLIKFMDHEYILTTSEIQDDQIRLLNVSTDGAKYVRYFPAHSQQVTSISTSDYLILSGSKDTTVNIFDARNEPSIKRFEFGSPTLAAFHPFGEIFAVAYDDSKIKLFDNKMFEEFSTFKFEEVNGVQWKSLKFSPCGKYLMVTTNSTSILIIDASSGEELHNFRDYSNPDHEHIEACFSIDNSTNARFVFGGSFEGLIHVWDLMSSQKVHTLKSGFEGPCYNVEFNPKFMNLLSSGQCLHMWIERD